MSIDVCFWWQGKPSLSPEELYKEAADGVSENFEPSSLVIDFRERLAIQWPGIEDSLEPLAYDPDLDEQEDLSRFILVTLSSGRAEVLPEIIEMARTFRLTGYDPQSEQGIARA
ncbi:hypothetical protein [Streptomyces fructofermentans]|uniref:hypothetical protein n=1 Tax=Streptomyces fructofermentans TaxID=152141 RepID=UPI00379C3A60